MSRFAFNPEMSSGAITPTGGEAAASSAIDMHRATVFQPGIESHASAAMAGAEQSIMTAVQAAAQPISPLIQMIMRMPGQIGLMSSMFEALGSFLMGHANILAGFDPSILAGAHEAMASLPGLPGAEHAGFNFSLLPADAPILQNLHGLGALGNNGSEFMSIAKGGVNQFNTQDILKDSVAFRDSLKVSGTLDLNKPQFEMGRGLSNQVEGLSKNGDALSGPAMREAGSATHLAGANRLFADRPIGLTSHTPLTNSSSTVASAQSVPISGATPASMNVSGSNFQTDMSASGQMSDIGTSVSSSQNVGFGLNQLGKSAADSAGTTSSIGPSGGVGDQLGANKFIAMDKGVASFHPTLGTPDASVTSGYDAGYLQHQTPTEAGASSHNLGGLKAKELTLDSVTNSVKSHAASAHSAASHASATAATTHAATSHAAPAHDATAHNASTSAEKSATDHSVSHAKSTADQHIAHHSKPTMDHIGHQTAGSSHSHSSSFSGRDGIAHVNRAPGHVEQPKLAAQPAAQQQMFKPATPAATNASFEQVAPQQQMAGADGSQVAQGADGAQVTDGTQMAQAGDATSQAPGGVDAAQSAPAAPTTYTIRAGDCLWNIAKDHLGSATRWSDIYKMNADVLGTNPSLIHPGTNINLPGSGSDLASAGAEHGTYIVKAGDNLWNISKHMNGDGSKWGEIYNLNKDVIGSNPSLIMPGQELHLPGAEASGTLAQAPTAAASQQLASVPQAATAAPGAPTGGGVDLRMEGGTPLTADAAAMPETPVQSYAPSELQAQAPAAAAPEQAMEAPQAPAPQAALGPSASPMAQQAAAPVGPGAAAAATLPPQPSAAELHQLASKNNVVSSNLTADLAQFIRKAK